MRLSEFFNRAGTKKIVINSDIDGFLSGMILQKYYDCEIVGFSNSKESIWLTPNIESVRTPVYIDIFINCPETYCIDQHIVAYDNNHINRLLAYGTKLNPNLNVSRRTYIGDLGENANYYRKYPFGTVHFLIALMKEDGIEVEFNDLSQVYTVNGTNSQRYDTCPGQIIMRADDALYSSLGPYEDNANEWWEILNQYNSEMIRRLIQYKNSCNRDLNREYKMTIGEFFQIGLNCDGQDGAFNTITNADGKTLQTRIVEYNRVINKIIGINMELPNELVEHRGVAQRSFYNDTNINNAFTYAFVCGPTKPGNAFSFTTIDIN